MATKKLHRSACLTNDVEVVQTPHISPLEQLRRVNISPACRTNPDTKIPVSAFFQLLENSAPAAGVENFGLHMALDAMRNYGHLQAAAVTFLFEENDGFDHPRGIDAGSA